MALAPVPHAPLGGGFRPIHGLAILDGRLGVDLQRSSLAQRSLREPVAFVIGVTYSLLDNGAKRPFISGARSRHLPVRPETVRACNEGV